MIHRIIWIDTETTGLDPVRHEIIQIAIHATDPLGAPLGLDQEWECAPERLEGADPRALEICGYDPEAWAGAAPMAVALRQALGVLRRDDWIGGHNLAFDSAMISEACRAAGIPLPVQLRDPRRQLDTMRLAQALRATGQVDALSLQVVARSLGIDRTQTHTALDDARMSAEVWRVLARRLA